MIYFTVSKSVFIQIKGIQILSITWHNDGRVAELDVCSIEHIHIMNVYAPTDASRRTEIFQNLNK